ncbi:MAG TPA: SHOCT domain-containing protein [Ktedonobacterales bacterium]|nr:SHOCT domain-containing protein [Ktedonobacterales bacterium]
MMRRGAVGRRGPGLLGTMARTAVIAGTATAVSRGVSGSMDQRAAQAQQAQQAQQQQQQAAFDAGFQQAQAQQTQAQQQQAASAAPSTDAVISQLRQLAELQNLGILTPDEFAQQKARILGGAS